eukprot:Em0014g708a
MWHEARKQEKKIRGVMIDFQRRAERRREHYERTRGDPNQLLRVYGGQCKLHLDPTGGERDSTMIPWQGDPDNLISRYDVRIHMDLIPDYSKLPEPALSRDEEVEEARCNYERYRALVLNAFKNVADSDALAKIDVDEMYPTTTPKDKKSKLKSQAKAAIAFKYDDSSGGGGANDRRQDDDEEEGEDDEDKEFSSESEFEMDVDVDSLLPAQVDKLNLLALSYGISLARSASDNLRAEKEQLEEQKLARLADLEKSNFSGKKARRERRLLKEKRVVSNRQPTPPSYASRSSPTYEPYGPDEEEGKELRERYPQSSNKPLQSRGLEKKLSPQGGRRRKLESPHSSGSSHNARSKRSRSPDRRRRRSSSWRHSERSRTRSRSRERRRRRSRSDSSDNRGRRRGRRSRSSSHNGASRSSRVHTSSRGEGRRSPMGRGRRSPPRGRSPSSSRSPSPRRHSISSSSSSSKSRRQPSPSPPVPQRTRGSPSPREEVGGAKVAKDNSEPLSPEDSEVPAEEERRDTPPEKPKAPVTAVKTKEKDKAKLTPQEKLKKRMQAQLNKQYKTDKRQQRQKEDQKEAERMEREEEMREQTRKIKERDPYGEARRSISRSPSPRHSYDYS